MVFHSSVSMEGTIEDERFQSNMKNWVVQEFIGEKLRIFFKIGEGKALKYMLEEVNQRPQICVIYMNQQMLMILFLCETQLVQTFIPSLFIPSLSSVYH